MPDDYTNKCLKSGDPFSFFSRRHHCRGCGGIFSSKCTETRLPFAEANPGSIIKFWRSLRGYAPGERVCGDCASRIKSGSPKPELPWWSKADLPRPKEVRTSSLRRDRVSFKVQVPPDISIDFNSSKPSAPSKASSASTAPVASPKSLPGAKADLAQTDGFGLMPYDFRKH